MAIILSLISLFKRKEDGKRRRVQDDRCTCTISVMLELPVELWITILSFVPDQRTLARFMRVNYAFNRIAERALYHTITLQGDRAMALFNKSLELYPGREHFVNQLHVTELDFGHRHTFLSTLPNLQYLALMSTSECAWQRNCDYILLMRFPFLRGFATNLPITSMDVLNIFLAAHPDLDELDLAGSRFVHESASGNLVAGLPKLPFASLRILGYHSPFLVDQQMSAPIHLTHLYRPTCSPLELDLITHLKQLVSLRLGPDFGGWRTHWSLYSVAKSLPRLRFFQVDMIQGDVPDLNKDVVDWTMSRGDVPRPAHFGPRMTIAWMYTGYLKSSLYSVSWADAWEDYLERAALEVLRTWGDVVKRVIYRHTEIPMTTLTLRASGNVYQTQVIDRRDDHWKRV